MPIGALPSFVVHDMANAVNAIAGVSDTLARHRQRLSDDQFDSLVTSLQRQSAMLRRLLGDLGDLAQLEAGAFSVALRPVHLHEVVEAALGQVNAPADAVHVRVPTDVEVLADPERLMQIVVNLLSNARVHGGPTTWIDVTRTGTTATIAISDDGEGLDPAIVETLFEQYRRGPSSRGRPGTGLGLAIVRGLSRAFGGDVRYVRRPRGSQFVVELEALAPVTTATAEPASAPFDHAAVVSTDLADLEDEIAQLVVDGLDAGDAVIVLATTRQWRAARDRLGHRAEELRSALGTGQVEFRDAAALLGALHDGTGVARAAFDDHVADLVATSARRWGDVRVFGEMAGLAWSTGDVVGAQQLEAHWNQLLERRRFGLLCGYQVPDGTVAAHADLLRVGGDHGFVYVR